MREEYAARFIEGSLGLPSGSLSHDDVPSDLCDELTSVLRGTPPGDTTSPSIEASILSFLRVLELESIEKSGYFVRKARWPGAAPFAVCLTHDVDNLERPKEHIEKVRERFGKADYARWKRGEISLYDNAALIAEREAALGFRSSFYYLSSEYPLEDARPVARRLVSRGWDVGLHGDFGTHESEEVMVRAVARFTKGMGFKPKGIREHYLRFDFSKTWGIMEKAGFDYDTTVGNADALGFKLGLATPFHPPDGEWKAMQLLELPLSLMDTTLWGYLKKSETEGHSDVKRFMREVAAVEGLFTLLWHPESVRMRGGRLYWKVLRDLARTRGAFVASGAGIAKWWRSREVPLKVSGEVASLGAGAPAGLVLVLKAAEGRRLKVTGGSATRGRGREYLVRPRGRSLKVKVLRGV